MKLGDSFIAKGHELSNLVAQLVPPKVEVLNMASPGQGPFQYLRDLQGSVLSFKPDLVVLSYYVGNDLTSIQYASEDSPVKNDTHFRRPRRYSSYLYNFYLEKKRLIRPKKFDYREVESRGIDEQLVKLMKTGEVNPWLVELSLTHPNYLLDNILMEKEDNMKAWERVREILEQIYTLSTKVDAQLIVVIFPRSIQINKSHFEFFRKLKFNIDERANRSNKPQRLLLNFCRDKEIRCLDILPHFRALREEELYLENNDHLNTKGNERAAKLISEFISKTLMSNNE